MAERTVETESLENLQEELGYQFRDQDLLIQALTHSSCSPVNNERLEFLGDAVLKFVLSRFLFKALDLAGEGDLTKERAALETNVRLAHVANELNVASLIRLGKGARKDGIGKNEGVLAGVVEAIIAAVYLDGTLDDVVGLIHRHLDLNWNSEDLATGEVMRGTHSLVHPKTELQEFTIKQFGVYPLYSKRRQKASENALTWEVRCTIPDTEFKTEGVGANIQAAETIAAEKMLALVQQ